MTETREGRLVAAGAWLRACATGAMAMAVLAGCGGGGGGSSDSQDAPKTLVTADKASTFAGDSAIELHINANVADVPSWTLDGPGRVVRSSVVNGWIEYVPPDAGSIDKVTMATLTFTLGSAVQSMVFTLSPTAPVGIAWQPTVAPPPRWQAVAADNAGFVAVSRDGDVWQSFFDGQHWIPRNAEIDFGGFATILWNGTQWLAIGIESGSVITSSDGTNWLGHSVSPFLPSGYSSLAWNGDTYVLAEPSGISQVSHDGLVWTPLASGPALKDVAFGQGHFVGVSSSGVMVSSDGVSWTTTRDTPTNLETIAFGNGRFVATGDFIGSATSLDGVTWTTSATPLVSNQRPSFAGGLFFLAGYQGTYTSADGQSWSFASLATNYSGFSSVAALGGRYVGVTANGEIAVSSNGATWSDVLLESPGALHGLDAFNGSLWTVSDGGYLLQSTDKQHWSRSHIAANGVDSFQAMGIVHGNGVLVTVGGTPSNAGNSVDGTVFSSSDGVTWTRSPISLPRNLFRGVVFDGHRFVAITSDGSVYTSTDGNAWSILSTVANSVFITGIGFVGGQYFAFGGSAAISVSNDAVHWVAAGLSLPPGDSLPQFSAVAHDGTRFVAVGSHGSAAVSTDDRNWTVFQAIVYTGMDFTAVTSAKGLFVAVGSSGSVMTSADGTHWTWRPAPHAAHANLNSVAFVDDRFIAVGDNGEILSSLGQ